MVFQSAIPVAFGVVLTPWRLEAEGLLAAGLALFSGLLLWTRVRFTRRLTVGSLLLGGAVYAVFVVVTLGGFLR
jgi:hypothetical protein